MNRIDAQKAYLERLRSMRRREERHLSVADFQVFVKRFEQLIRRVETELQALESALNTPIQTFPNGIVCTTLGPAIRYLKIGEAAYYFGPVNSHLEPQYSAQTVLDYLPSVIQKRDIQPSRIETAQIRSMNADGQLRLSDIQRPVLCAQAA